MEEYMVVSEKVVLVVKDVPVPYENTAKQLNFTHTQPEFVFADFLSSSSQNLRNKNLASALLLN